MLEGIPQACDYYHFSSTVFLVPLRAEIKEVKRDIYVMAEVILCNHLVPAIDIPGQCGLEIHQLQGPGCINPDKLMPHTPYIVKSKTSSEALNSGIINQLSSAPAVKELTQLSHAYGGDTVASLAQIHEKLMPFNLALLGASTSTYATRMTGFAGAVKNYQGALIDYRSKLKSKPAVRNASKQKVFSSHQRLQRAFTHEINVTTGQAASRRGTPITNPQRALNIATSSRTTTKLNISSQVEASNLVRFTKHAKYLGNGLAVIDFGTRTGRVHSSYKEGGDWERELFKESLGFAGSAIAGIATVKMGLGLLMFVTPYGWAWLVVGGVTTAAVSAGTSVYADSVADKNADKLYQNILRLVENNGH
jgi:hypothetical protein